MNDAEFGRRVAQRLNQSLEDIDQPILDKLQEARKRALAHPKVTQAQWSTAAGSAGRNGANGGGTASVGGYGGRLTQHHTRMWLGIAAITVLAAMAGVSYWQQSQHENDQGALDAAMLSGELPLHAFTHSDFKAWISESR